MKCGPKYRKQKTRKTFEPERWVWQSAYADCLARQNVLPSYIFEQLTGYVEEDRYSLQKHYKNEQEAIDALRTILDRMEKDVDRYRKRLTC
jgi:hypothetical protein